MGRAPTGCWRGRGCYDDTRPLDPDGIVPEHISARLLKVRVIFKHRTATTFIVGYAPTETAATCHKSKF